MSAPIVQRTRVPDLMDWVESAWPSMFAARSVFGTHLIRVEDRMEEGRYVIRAELPGILAWAVRGCREWQAHGLQSPAEVTRATAQYRADMDDLAGWLAECCTVAPDATAYAQAAVESFNAYTGQRITPKRLARALTERGFTSTRTMAGVRWQGFGLLGASGSPASM